MSLIQAFVLCTVVVLSHGWVNNFDQPVHFSCPGNSYLTRIHSIHSNHHEDRLWDYSCSGNVQLTACSWSPFVNGYDEFLAYTCPDDSVMTGMASIHHNHQEDRIFQFRCCTVTGKRPLSCSTTGLVNGYDGDLNFQVGSGQVIKGAYSQHSNHHEDRRWRFYSCTLR